MMLELAVTSRDDNKGILVTIDGLSYHLPRAVIAFSRDRTGIDDINIRLLFEIDDFKVVSSEALQNGFTLKVVQFATYGSYGNLHLS